MRTKRMCETCHGTFAKLWEDEETGRRYCRRDWGIMVRNHKRRDRSMRLGALAFKTAMYAARSMTQEEGKHRRARRDAVLATWKRCLFELEA